MCTVQQETNRFVGTKAGRELVVKGMYSSKAEGKEEEGREQPSSSRPRAT